MKNEPHTVGLAHPAFSPGQVIEILRPYITDQRFARLTSVIAQRTHTVVPVIEGLINLGNVSAVMRSAEALGFHHVHIIEGGSRFKNSQRTSQGAEKWLEVSRWATPEACLQQLKAAGYAVVATHLDETAVPIGQIDFTQPTALVFGNEKEGITEALLARADKRCVIPMTGFVQSFNISVAAALALYHAYQDRRSRQGFQGDLHEKEKLELLASYCFRSVKHAEKILKEAVDDMRG